MANRTDPSALTIHGTNPQNLIEKILRNRIYDNNYWKEHCFGLTAETLVDKAVKLKSFGGTYGGNKKPTPFICLILKMLQIQPEKEIIIEFIQNQDYRYVRLLGAFYLRLVGKPMEIYQYLEPLYNDYRKVRQRIEIGYQMTHVDEFIEVLLHSDFYCDIALPYLPKRSILEETEHLPPRVSGLEDELDEEASDEENVVEERRKDQFGRDIPKKISKKRSSSPLKIPEAEEEEEEEERPRDKDGSLSIEETNKLRAKLGLKPLK